ncbi:MAG: DsbE family thiol:disulfide interchange protein [Steroidobacteraceae bacterium]
MNRFSTTLVVFGLVVIVFAVALSRAPDKQVVTSALIGKTAPEFTLPNLLQPGTTVTNTTLKGRWYLLNVWATWCVECRAEHSVLMDIQREGKVVVLGVNYQDKDDDARQWLLDLGNPYEFVAVDRDGRVLIDYGGYGAPENFLVNPQGIIVKKTWGLTPKSWLAIRKEFIDGVKP